MVWENSNSGGIEEEMQEEEMFDHAEQPDLD